MKRENYYKFIWIVSALLILGFVISLAVDYCKYDPITTSAPFYVNIIIRALEFILPSIIIYIVGIFCRRKFTK